MARTTRKLVTEDEYGVNEILVQDLIVPEDLYRAMIRDEIFAKTRGFMGGLSAPRKYLDGFMTTTRQGT